MLQITVLIRLTGLLLLTPDKQAGDLPMHVLMPSPGAHVPMPHVPEIGFLTSSAAACKPYSGSTTAPAAFQYDPQERVCYVNMNGWWMEIGTRRIGNPPAPQLPPGVMNLSTALGFFVERSLLGNTPDSRIRSRVTLNDGVPGDTCNRFRFRVRKRDVNGTVKDTVLSLTNVLDWQIHQFQQPNLVLVRRRLNPPQGMDKPDTLFIVPPRGGVITLFVRQLTQKEKDHVGIPSPALGDSATHFHAYLDLLKVPESGRRVPTLQSTGGPPCDWPFVPSFVRPLFSPGTAGCMVASALPTSP